MPFAFSLIFFLFFFFLLQVLVSVELWRSSGNRNSWNHQYWLGQICRMHHQEAQVAGSEKQKKEFCSFFVIFFKKKKKIQRFSDEFLAKFQEEVPLLVTLQHPNIMRFLGVCVDDSLCTIHQYVRGCNLYGYLRNEGNLVDLNFIAATARGIAAGISYLHARKIIHRNLHSKNVILDGEMVPKLRDYGMQFMKQETYQLAIGPVVYEAPELLARLPYTEAVDAYSFGVLLWEIFCRELPHKQLQPVAIKEQVLGSDLRPDITPDIPVVFRRLMSACWNKEAERRPSFVVVGKILNKPAEELGSYGTEGGATLTYQPKG